MKINIFDHFDSKPDFFLIIYISDYDPSSCYANFTEGSDVRCISITRTINVPFPNNNEFIDTFAIVFCHKDRLCIQHIPVSTKIKTILNWLMRWNVGYWHRSSSLGFVTCKYRLVSRMICLVNTSIVSPDRGQRQSILTPLMYLTAAVAG